MSLELPLDPKFLRLVGHANFRALESMRIERGVVAGHFPGPTPKEVFRTPMRKLIKDRSGFRAEMKFGDKLGVCTCGSTAQEVRLNRFKGCVHCRNSKSDSFVEGW